MRLAIVTVLKLSQSKRGSFNRVDENCLDTPNGEALTLKLRLRTIRRSLNFSGQSVNRGKTYLILFIKSLLEIVFRAAENIDRFPNLRRILNCEIGK